MNDNPWSGAESAPKSEAELPNVTDLASTLFSTFQKDMGMFVIAGLPPALFAMFAGVGAVFAIYGGMLLGMAPGLLADDEDLMVLGSVGGLLLGMVGLMALLVVVLTPMQVSLWRACWAYLDRGEKMTFGSCVSHAWGDLPRILAFNVVHMSLVLLGSMMCYVPGLVLAMALTFAYPAVVVHGRPIGESIGTSIRHFMANPAWHLGLFAVVFLMSLVLPYIPVLGYALFFTLYPTFVLLAYRAGFTPSSVSAVPA